MVLWSPGPFGSLVGVSWVSWGVLGRLGHILGVAWGLDFFDFFENGGSKFLGFSNFWRF